MLGWIVTAALAQAQAERWVEVGLYADRRVHIDAVSLRREPPHVVYWVRHTYNVAQADGTLEARYEEDVDCDARSIGPRSYVMRNRSGEIIDSGIFAPELRQQRQPIDPGTMREAIFEALCGTGRNAEVSA